MYLRLYLSALLFPLSGLQSKPQAPFADVYKRQGYYFGRNGKQRTSIAGISWDGTALSPTYRFDTQKGQEGYYDGAYQYVGNGNHN